MSHLAFSLPLLSVYVHPVLIRSFSPSRQNIHFHQFLPYSELIFVCEPSQSVLIPGVLFRLYLRKCQTLRHHQSLPFIRHLLNKHCQQQPAHVRVNFCSSHYWQRHSQSFQNLIKSCWPFSNPCHLRLKCSKPCLWDPNRWPILKPRILILWLPGSSHISSLLLLLVLGCINYSCNRLIESLNQLLNLIATSLILPLLTSRIQQSI